MRRYILCLALVAVVVTVFPSPSSAQESLTVKIVISLATPTSISPIPVTVQFSSSVTGFDENDIDVSSATLQDFSGSGAEYTFNLIPTNEGLIKVKISAGVANDSAGDTNDTGSEESIIYSTSGPKGTMFSSTEDLSDSSTISVTVVFEDKVVDFDESDIALRNATISNFTGSGTNYSFDLISIEEGNVSAEVKPGMIHDSADNANVSAISFRSEHKSTTGLVVYVSNSDGNDAYDGLSPSSAKKTIGAGFQVLRDGEPDWLLLKRGDTWVNEPLGFEFFEGTWSWNKSGKSASERMIVSSYGSSSDELPLIRDCEKPGMFVSNNRVDFFTVQDVHFFRSSFSLLGPMEDFTIKECVFEQGGVSCQSYAGVVHDFKIIGCAIFDAYNTEGHAQGVYVKALDGLTIDNCLFDHNGWNEDVEGAERTMFNHNIYVQNGNKNVSITNSIISRGSSQGVMLRAGGILSDNLFARNYISASIGGGYPDEEHLGEGVVNEGVTSTMNGNVIIESDGPANGWGVIISNTKSINMSENIIANDISASTGCGIYLFGNADSFDGKYHEYVGVNGLQGSNNIVYNNGYNIRVQGTLFDALFFDNLFQAKDDSNAIYYMDDTLAYNDDRLSFNDNKWHCEIEGNWIKAKPITVSFEDFSDFHDQEVAEEIQFRDPTRNIESYCQDVLGKELTYDQFFDEAVANWGDSEYSAATIIEYIREGFGIIPVTLEDIFGEGANIPSVNMPMWTE